MVGRIENETPAPKRRRRLWIAATLFVGAVALVLAIRARQLPSAGVFPMGAAADQTVRLANRGTEAFSFHVAAGTESADVQLAPQTRARCDIAEPPDGRITITVKDAAGEMRAVITVDASGLGAHEVVVQADGTVSGGSASLSTLAGL